MCFTDLPMADCFPDWLRIFKNIQYFEKKTLYSVHQFRERTFKTTENVSQNENIQLQLFCKGHLKVFSKSTLENIRKCISQKMH